MDDTAVTADDVINEITDEPGGDVEVRGLRWFARRAVWVALALFAIFLLITQAKARSTLVTVVIAVAASAGLWIGANLLFNQVRERWAEFSVIAFGIVGALIGIVLHGNQVTVGSGDGILNWILGPIAGGVALAALGFVLSTVDDASKRLTIGIGVGLAIGVAIGALIRSEFYPGLDPAATAIATALGVAVGGVISFLRKRPPLGGILTGAAIGWILGAWGGADFGDGSIVTSIIAAAVPAALIGARIGQTSNPGYVGRAKIDVSARAYIFIGPALLFIFAMLVVPAIRTAYLSVLDRDSEDFVQLDNYRSIFTDRTSFDSANWTDMFTSRLSIIGVVLLGIALVVGIIMKQRTGRAVEVGNPTVGPLVAGFFFVAFGIFTALRGTIINNLWWVVTVTFSATALGLAVAVLADNRKGERFAKSLIFMPMAISLVGASIIWRFVYQARETSKEQTGVLNALWTSLGKLSIGSGLPTLIGAAILGVITLASAAALARALTRQNWGGAALPGIAMLLFGWFFLKYTKILGEGLGGFQTEAVLNDDGEQVGTVATGAAETVLFVQEGPFNNFFLMVIFIWIQTGFAMVILSAAIKAVPTELIEAASMDGATTSQIFWRVTLPQIATTIGVVVTTLIVGVMKVFDIVKVITNGQFDTQVLANDMFQKAFNDGDSGRGAALAILIFLSVLPVMIFNIRKMQKEA